MPRKDNANAPASAQAQAQQDAVSEGIENFELPRALVTRIAKSAVPENVKLQKDTVLSLVKGATVFINYLAATAHEVSTSKQHKSISASDVFKALEHIEFADLIPPLQAELQVYRELAKNKKGSSAGGASGSTPQARGKSGAQRGKGKERMTTEVGEGEGEGDSRSSAPLPNALGALSLEVQQPHGQANVDAPGEAPTTDAEAYTTAEQDDGAVEAEDEGEGDDEDQTEPEPEADEAEEEDEDLDVDDVDEDVDMQVDADMREDRDDMEDDGDEADDDDDDA